MPTLARDQIVKLKRIVARFGLQHAQRAYGVPGDVLLHALVGGELAEGSSLLRVFVAPEEVPGDSDAQPLPAVDPSKREAHRAAMERIRAEWWTHKTDRCGPGCPLKRGR